MDANLEKIKIREQLIKDIVKKNHNNKIENEMNVSEFNGV